MSAEPELDIKEEYQLWRKNCKFMYEFVSETALTWPSLTVEWLPEYIEDEDNNVINARLLLGTHTSGSDKEYLKLASTKLPNPAKVEKAAKTKVSSIIKISKKFQVQSEINRARYKPQDPSVASALLNSGEVNLFELSLGKSIGSFDTDTENGYCLLWNNFEKNQLLTCLKNNGVAIHDINRLSSSDRILVKAFGHQDVVNDAGWHNFNNFLFASVSDDARMLLFDARTPDVPVSSYHSLNSKGINTLAFSPFSCNLLALGCANSNISLIDLRMLGQRNDVGLLHTMMGHGDAVTCVDFSPHQDGILASGSQDRRVIIWDIAKIGEEQAQEDAEDGLPEIFMMHAGHTGAITDLSWCPFSKWTLATLADDNIVHLWQVSRGLTEDAVMEDVVLE